MRPLGLFVFLLYTDPNIRIHPNDTNGEFGNLEIEEFNFGVSEFLIPFVDSEHSDVFVD